MFILLVLFCGKYSMVIVWLCFILPVLIHTGKINRCFYWHIMFVTKLCSKVNNWFGNKRIRYKKNIVKSQEEVNIYAARNAAATTANVQHSPSSTDSSSQGGSVGTEHSRQGGHVEMDSSDQGELVDLYSSGQFLPWWVSGYGQF